MATEKVWFETVGRDGFHGDTVWYWDGTRSWYSPRGQEQLRPSEFTVRGMRASSAYQEIPNPWIPVELRLPDGL